MRKSEDGKEKKSEMGSIRLWISECGLRRAQPSRSRKDDSIGQPPARRAYAPEGEYSVMNDNE